MADIFTLRKVDLGSGAVTDVKRMHAVGNDMEYPFAVGLGQTTLALSSWFTGTVQLIDRASGKTTSHAARLQGAVRRHSDGRRQPAGGRDWPPAASPGPAAATSAPAQPLASGLAGPVQMVLGPDGKLYVTEAAGNIQRIDTQTGAKTQVATGLAMPEGLAFTPWGSLVVAEAAAGRLTELDLAANQRRSIAEGLPIGLSAGPGMPPPYVPTGVAVGADGSIYLSADRNNAIYRIRPVR